jgi:hypothetical protein
LDQLPLELEETLARVEKERASRGETRHGWRKYRLFLVRVEFLRSRTKPVKEQADHEMTVDGFDHQENAANSLWRRQ